MADNAERLSILVVEDESLLRMAAADMFEEAGYDVIEAETGDEGLVAVNSGKRIAALLTDVEMPGDIDGLMLAKITRQAYPDAVIFIVSGRVRPSPDDLPEGATFMGKPYNGMSVLRALDRMIGRIGS